MVGPSAGSSSIDFEVRLRLWRSSASQPIPPMARWRRCGAFLAPRCSVFTKRSPPRSDQRTNATHASCASHPGTAARINARCPACIRGRGAQSEGPLGSIGRPGWMQSQSRVSMARASDSSGGVGHIEDSLGLLGCWLRTSGLGLLIHHHHDPHIPSEQHDRAQGASLADEGEAAWWAGDETASGAGGVMEQAERGPMEDSAMTATAVVPSLPLPPPPQAGRACVPCRCVPVTGRFCGMRRNRNGSHTYSSCPNLSTQEDPRPLRPEGALRPLLPLDPAVPAASTQALQPAAAAAAARWELERREPRRARPGQAAEGE